MTAEPRRAYPIHFQKIGITMTEYTKNLLEERNKANKAARDIVDAALAENRSLTAEDTASIEKADADFERHNTMLTELRKIEARESENRAAMQDHPEARPAGEDRSVSDDADVLRKIAKGEVRGHTFEKRDVLKSSTGSPVPTSFYDRIIEVARYVGPMLETSTVLNTVSGEALQIPRTNAYSTAAVVAEAGAISESDPTFSAFITLGAFKYSYLVQLSNEMIEDSGVDILGYLGTNLGQAIGFAANADLTVGTGTTQPVGIVTASAVGGTGATAIAGAFSTNNVIDLVYSLNAAVRRMPSFGVMGGTKATSAARKLTDGANQYVWQPSLIEGQPDRLLGYTYTENPHIADPATSAKSLIAGDLSSYMVRQVGGVRLDRSDDFAFSTGLVTFRAIFRVDGNLPQSQHVKHFLGGAS